MGRILIIDDEIPVAEMMAESLEDAGHHTVIAWNGEEGLQRAMEQRPDVIVTDLMMPVMDGWQLCHSVQADAGLRQVPIVVVSAAPERAWDRGCRFAAVLRKPFELAELIRTVDQVLDRSS